jgi:putative oxidoreductase
VPRRQALRCARVGGAITQKWDRPPPVSGVPITLPISYAVNRGVLQRLFSTFASGWPGVGLLLLRLLTGAVFIYFGIASMLAAPPLRIVVLEIFGVGAGILFVVGLWTPAVGALAVIVKLWIACSRLYSHSGNPWFPVVHAVLGAVLAMVGPGAWSIDARLFGRKHINFPEGR